jgi:heavy metal sensor kinase
VIRSLKARLLAWTIGGMAALLAVFGLLVNWAAHRALDGGFNESLATAARMIAASVKQERDKIEVEVDDQEMPEFRRTRKPDYFQLWTADGAVVKRSISLGQCDLERIDATPGKPVFHAVTLPDGRAGRAAVLIFTPTVEDEEEKPRESGQPPPATPRPVTLIVARGTADLDSSLALLRWLLVGAAGGTIALTLVVAAIVVRQGLRPLDSLAARIAAIRENTLSAVIPVDEMPREIAPIGRRLNDLLKRLDEAFRRERAFAADAAHELRTPLAGLRATLEVALSRPRKTDEYEESFRDSLTIVQRMQSMVDSLLVLARIENDQMTLRREPVRLAEAVESCWRPLADAAQDRGIRLTCRVPDDLECLTDREKLAMVLANLLANAAEYADDGGRIDIIGREEGGAAVLDISNTGCRLAEDEARHAFERFWRGDAARADTGVHCGLGLALVQRMTAFLGGTAAVRIAGGVFTASLSLPAAPRDGAALPASPEPASPAGPAIEPVERRFI